MSAIILKNTRTGEQSLHAAHGSRGGVHAVPGAPAGKGLHVLAEPRQIVGVSAAFPNFAYHGGPVVKCPQIYAAFWGGLWTSDPNHLVLAGRITEFLKDLLSSKFMNILSQYGVGFGAGIAGSFVRASFVTSVPSVLTNVQIQGVIQNSINAGVIPEPPGTNNNIVLMIYLDDNTGVSDGNLVVCETGGDAFGYHTWFNTSAGHPFFYAIMPGLTDNCLKQSCQNDAFCSLHLAETQEQRITQVSSHEFAEMTTDPQLNGWFSLDLSHEIGDICNGEADTITVDANTWTVQRQYSKTDDINSNGSSFCLAEAPNPIPKLSPGPASLTVGHPRIAELHSLNALLPLPPMSFDHETSSVSVEQADVVKYVSRIFHPFDYSRLVPDLPGLLRVIADALSAAEGAPEAQGKGIASVSTETGNS